MSTPKDLKTAVALRFRYIVDFSPVTIEVTDPDSVASILSTLTIHSTKPGSFALMLPMGLVTFIFDDGSEAELKMLGPTAAEYVDYGGLVIDPAFHFMFNKLAGENSGRRIEVTENNC